MKKNEEMNLANIETMQIGNDQGDNTPVGQVCFANASRFVEAHFSEPLTTYAVGWRDPQKIEDTLEFVAPMVSTSRRFEFAQANNAEEWMSEADDVRDIGSDFKRVEFSQSKVQSKTLNKGLIIRVDEDNVDGMPNWREIYTGRLMRRLLRNELRRAIALLYAACTEMSVVGSGDTGGGATWGSTADPDKFGDTAGINANRALFGFSAWTARIGSYAAQSTARGFAGLARNLDLVAGYAGLDEARVTRERYQLNLTAKSKILGSYVLVYLAESGQTPEDPSSVKRFVSSTAGGTPFRVYEQRISAKLIDISVEHYSNIVATSTLGLQKITVTAA
jgi:hypothetical protein